MERVMAEMRAIDPKLLKAMKYEEMRVQFRVSRDVFCPRAKPSWMKNSFPPFSRIFRAHLG
jgi:hypothetical protein